jgi:hypothetical protein
MGSCFYGKDRGLTAAAVAAAVVGAAGFIGNEFGKSSVEEVSDIFFDGRPFCFEYSYAGTPEFDQCLYSYAPSNYQVDGLSSQCLERIARAVKMLEVFIVEGAHTSFFGIDHHDDRGGAEMLMHGASKAEVFMNGEADFHSRILPIKVILPLFSVYHRKGYLLWRLADG